MIRVTTSSRIHLALIDLNASLGRVDGGIGISLKEPNICITAELSDSTVITGDDILAERMKAAVRAVYPDATPHIHIEEFYPSHSGLGSGTQAALAVGMAVNKLYNLKLDVVEIGRRVGRGGTSGVGIAAFENGGFILDGGHNFSDKKAFSPSSVSRADPPPILAQYEFPDWDIVLAIPDVKGASSKREVDIFNKICPVPLGEVQALSHIILMKMLPAVIEKDFKAFVDAISRIQHTGFKKHEIIQQIGEVKKLMNIMSDVGGKGVGLSSFGPTIYAVTKTPDEVKKAAEEFLNQNIGGKVIITHACNHGALLR